MHLTSGGFARRAGALPFSAGLLLGGGSENHGVLLVENLAQHNRQRHGLARGLSVEIERFIRVTMNALRSTPLLLTRETNDLVLFFSSLAEVVSIVEDARYDALNHIEASRTRSRRSLEGPKINP